MKILLSILVLSFSSCSAVYAKTIPADKFPAYKKAVIFALSKKPLDCVFSKYGWSFRPTLESAVLTTTSGDLSSNSSQPLLTLVTEDEIQKASFKITTSADFKSILSVSFEQSSCAFQEVNIGDLANPNLVVQKICNTDVTATCQ